MFVAAERFILNLVKRYGQHSISTDGGTWYPQACRFLKLRHHIRSPYEKNIIERTVQYIKDRTENLMTIFLAEKVNVNCNTYKNGLIYLSVIITIIVFLTLQSQFTTLWLFWVYDASTLKCSSNVVFSSLLRT
jgi:hypothetical protein